jgi:sarcosine oxidase subunit gamma|tara:strand:- start:400 stop:1029 length:630 start_codon:yes stop_codon:yes gene_type:complete
MVNAYLRQSPLAHLHLAARATTSDALPDAGVILAEIPYLSQFVLRGNAGDQAFTAGIKKALKLPLPISPCTSSVDKTGHSHILWMGPDEWLIVGPSDDQAHINSSISKAFKNQHFSLVDVSESRTLIRLRGTQAQSLLEKGCSIDLHPSAFIPGSVVNTHLSHAHITLHHSNSIQQPTYDLYVHRSFSEYLWSWLEDAAREYGLDNRSK